VLRPRWIAAAAAVALLAPPSAPAAAQAAAPDSAARDSAAAKAPPRAEQWVSRRTVTIDGKSVPYVATAGTLVLHDKEGQPTATMGYVAYTRSDAKDLAARPVTFAYNGGPGSSSIWLHMGALGPRRVAVSDAGPTPPPPYRVVDNDFSILGRTDLVLIDPVGTGLSRPAGKKKEKDFWGVDPDIESVGAFIKQYVTLNGRWNSPKYILGESYGTTRSAGLVDYLQTKEGMAFNGVVLVSVVPEPCSNWEAPGSDRPYPLFLPSFAATSWYHKLLPAQPPALGPFLDEVRAWASGPYTVALMKGDALSPAEKDSVAERIHRYTGLSADYIRKANLRVTEGEYTQQVLRERRETVGRLDSRFTGLAFDQLAQNAEYDPQAAAISAGYTAAFLDYYHRELGVPRDREYVVSAPAYRTWDWKHRVAGSEFPQMIVNTTPDLAHALGYNPELRVLVLNGLFDLATPFLGTEYTMDHLGLTPELRSHVTMRYYEAGHMMYVNDASMRRMWADLAGFYDGAAGIARGR
jgi:carboxypeptidase C (cathepsin A)